MVIYNGGIMNILSLFDGISCGMVALKRAGIEVDNYYSSEIENSAITISNNNYPDQTMNTTLFSQKNRQINASV